MKMIKTYYLKYGFTVTGDLVLSGVFMRKPHKDEGVYYLDEFDVYREASDVKVVELNKENLEKIVED